MADPAGFIHETKVDGVFYPNTLAPHTNNMADAVPARKMFSSVSVGDEQYTEDNRGTSMAGIRAMAKAAQKANGLRKAVPKTPRP